jgi:hypothetical protein
MTKSATEKTVQVRDPVATQNRILKAAKREFAQRDSAAHALTLSLKSKIK